jgi:hypothetical protein
MSITWRKFMIFGLTASLPILSWIGRCPKEDEVETFRKYRAELATCEKCSRLYNVRAGAAWTIHLQEVHNMDLDDAIDVMAGIYRDLLILKARKKV